jgi:hypothetical protein
VSLNAVGVPSVPPMGHSNWIKPQEGRWKINWDAAIDKEALKMGIGILIMDAGGRVVATRTTFIPYIVDPTTAEAVAAWYSVSLGREIREHHPCGRFFGDCH